MQKRYVLLLVCASALVLDNLAFILPLGGLGGKVYAKPPRTVSEEPNIAVLAELAPNIAELDDTQEPIDIIEIIPGIPADYLDAVAPAPKAKRFKEKRGIASVAPKKPKSVKKPVELASLAPDEIAAFDNVLDYAPSEYYHEEEPSAPETPFGVSVSEIKPNRPSIAKVNKIEFAPSNENKKYDIFIGQNKKNPFVKTLESVKPTEPPKPASAKPADTVAYIPSLKEELAKTYLSENKYLSAMDIPVGAGDSRPSKPIVAELSPGPMKIGSREVLQMKLEFNKDSAAITGESINIIRSFAQVATADPTNAIEIGISDSVMTDESVKKLAARRLAIISNILRSAGLADRQISPFLAPRDADSFSFSIVNKDKYEQVKVGTSSYFDDDSSTAQIYDVMTW